MEDTEKNTQSKIDDLQSKGYRLDCRYMRMALIWSENSYCERRKVGALLVKNNRIIKYTCRFL